MARKTLHLEYLRRELKRLAGHFYTTYKEYIVFFTGLAVGLALCGYLVSGFLELLEEMAEKELTPFDDAVTAAVQSWRTDGLTKFFKILTDLGDRPFYIAACVLLGIYLYVRLGNLVFAFQATVVLGIASLINILLKGLIDRQRPDGEHLVEVSSLSFPSGHAMSSIAFYGFLIYILWQLKLKGIKKILLTVLLVAIILGIGLSRVYLGVHYPSDVLAGFAAGGACLAVFITAFYAIRFLNRKKPYSTS